MNESEAEAPDGAAGAAPEGARPEGEAARAAGNARERREAARYSELARRSDEQAREIALLRSRLAEAEEAGNRARVQSLEREIDAVSGAARQAFADGDPEAHVKAVRDVAELSARKALAEAAPRQPAAAAPAPGPVYTETTQAWLDANPWFQKEPGPTKVALGAHGAAVAANLVVDTPQYWAFVTERVNRAFPGKVVEPDGSDPTGVSPASPGAPAAGADDGAGAETVAGSAAGAAAHSGAAPPSRGAASTARPGAGPRLTPEQTEAAKIAGVTPQQYLAALVNGQKSGQFVPAARRQ